MKQNNLIKLLAFTSLLVLSSCQFEFINNNTTSYAGGGRPHTSTVQVPTTTKDDSYLTLVWEDEFDDETLNEKDWNYQTGDGSQYGIPGWGNNELQYYQKDNTRLENGHLIITAKKEQIGAKEYTSSRITTANKVSTCYGRIEAKMSLPIGTGLWPAFWMLPEADTPYGGWAASGEIDIMEARGRVDDMTSGALHFGSQGSSVYLTQSNVIRDGDISDFHVYAIEWTKEEIRWYVDDNNFMTITADRWWSTSPNATTEDAPFDWDFHILLNLAVGGNFDGGNRPSSDFVSAELKVDYVRIYEIND